MKFKSPFLALLLLMSVAACKKPQPPEVEQKCVLHLNLSEDPASLDPRSVRSIKDLTLVKQLFEGLMRVDSEGIPRLALAEQVEISENLLHYTFHLRDTFWSNGERVTAQDFVYAWSKALDASFASDYAYMLYPIKNAQKAREGKCDVQDIGVKIMDEKTLCVELHTPTPYFLELTAFPTYYPINHQLEMNQKNWAQPPGTCFVSNGPFSLKAWIPQTEIQFQKNPLYWDKDAVHLDGMAFSVISDNLTESYLFEKDQLDWLGQPVSQNISTELIHKIKESGELQSYPVAGTLWLICNLNKAPFTNENLRKAFAHAVNRQEIITHVLQGNQQVATNPVPPAMRLYSVSPIKDGDPSEARRFFDLALNEEGWSLQSLPKIQLSYFPNDRNNKIVQLLQQQVKNNLGLDIELIAVERHVYKKQVRQGNYQIGMGEWIADYNDPLAFLELFKYVNDPLTGVGMNDTGWHDERYTTLLDQSLKECDLVSRKRMLKEAEELLMENMPLIPLYHYAFDYAKKTYVKDVVLSPLGLADFKSASLSR